jgi:glycine betaine/proline transport system substrate-binding protein
MQNSWAVAVAVAVGLGLAGCGGATVGEATSQGSASADTGSCGTVNIAINPWVGYEANAAVIGHLAEEELGCTVVKKDLKEEVAWQGFATGEVDAVVENWGHLDLKAKYIQEQAVAVDLGPTGNKGIIGWYVPPWMAQVYPDITNWESLNKYADLFRTSESGERGQFLTGDPSFVTNDEALVKNLDLDFKVVQAGSEAALIQAFRTAEQNKTPMIGYFYEPQWFLSEVPLVHVNLPAYNNSCPVDPAAIACDYPPYVLDKIVSKTFADKNTPAFQLIKNFKWTNADQNLVAKYIAEDKMTPEEAAAKWVQEHPDTWKAWLPAA